MGWIFPVRFCPSELMEVGSRLSRRWRQMMENKWTGSPVISCFVCSTWTAAKWKTFLSWFCSCIKLTCLLFKSDNAHLLTAISEQRESSSWIIQGLYGLRWDTPWNSHVMRASWTFCMTSLRDTDAKDSYGVAAGRKKCGAQQVSFSCRPWK